MQIDFPVTRTKILVPRRRSEIVTRPRLLDTLNELLDNKLMIIAAPAGYGKTSLLVDFIHQSELPFCWYALDNLDRDPQRFIAHFISAINLRFPKFGHTTAQALNASSQDRLNVDSLVTTLINDAYENIREHFVIVLDDYHLVRESKLVDHFISRFIQDIDENCHLIIASRTLLTLPDLPLMVARSQVGGMSFEELSFRPEEIQTFLQQNYHRQVSDQEAREMAYQTEGWITGLLLSTQMLGQEIEHRLRVARASGVGLYEYLAQQVFQQQQPDLQEFLLRSSLLEEFDADSCQEVIGGALGLEEVDWNGLIDTLFQNNLFILPVGEERIWLRYHHLFRDFLRERIARERPDEAQRIQLRLAQVCIERSEWDQAFALYQRLGQTGAIADLAEKAGPSLIIRGRLVTLADWLNALPSELRSSRPSLLSLLATVTVMRGDTRQGLSLLNQAITALSQAGEPDKSQLAWALVRRSSTHRMLGDYTQALADAETALTLAAGDAGLFLMEAEAVRAKGSALNHQGKLVELLTWLNRSLETYQALKDNENVAKVSLEIGKVNETLGGYLASEKAYTKALDIWQATGNTIWQANLLNNLGVLQHLLGDYETAASTLEKAVQFAREGGYPRMEAFSLTSIGDLYRDLAASNEALDAYRWARLIAKQITDRFLILYLDLAEAGMARTQGQYFQAAELLNAARQSAQENQSPYEQHLCMLEGGCLKVARKEYQLALNELDQAAHFFSGEGHRVETIRAHLYLLVTLYATGSPIQAAEHSSQLFSLVSGPENRHPLVTAGREVRPLLEAMQSDLQFSPMIAETLEQIQNFEDNVPQIRRNLRRRAMAVPFAPPKMVIRALGRMQVKVNDRVITGAEWQTQACRDLFFLILAHPEGLSKEAIGAIFWPDASPAELRLRFKNNVYRVRHAVGKDAVYLQEDYYYFNRSMDYDYDAEAFLREISQAEQEETVERKLDHYQASLKLYKGSYLPEIEETWVIGERERLKLMNMDVLLKMAELHLKEKNFETALSFCQRALKEDRCLEAAHRLAMRIHAETGSRAALVRQYDECRKALLDEFAEAPSAQTQELYESLMKRI